MSYREQGNQSKVQLLLSKYLTEFIRDENNGI